MDEGANQVVPIGQRKEVILSGLNDQQRAVVTAVDGPTLVVAGAGTGKTTALIRRVAYLIEMGVQPESILLLTFTRAASHLMLARARSLAPEARNVIGGTFHSFSAQVLREAHLVFGLSQNFTVLDPEDCVDAIKVCISSMPFKDARNKLPAKTIAKMISYSTNTKLTIKEAIVRKAPNWVEDAEWVQEAKESYFEYKLARGLLDYDDLLLYLGILLQDQAMGPQIRSRHKYVMVDEHQDSNALQLDIIYGLGEDKANIMAVGDPAQAIYGFRGSSPGTMFDFVRHWPSGKILNLEINYRSTKHILNVVNAIDRSMTMRFDRELRPLSLSLSHRPALVLCRDQRHEAEEICARILRSKDEGHELKDHAVLVRSIFIARRLETELIAQRIPYRFVGGLRIDEAAHVKDVLSIVRIADNVKHEPAWMRILQRLPKIGIESSKPIIVHISTAECAADAIRLLETAPKPKQADLRPIIEALSVMIVEGQIGARIKAVVRAFEPVFEKVYKDTWNDRRRDIDVIATLSDDYGTLTDFLAAITLDYSIDKKEDNNPHNKTEEEPVTLSTIHSSKGLEWKFVHIPSLTNGHLPSMLAVTEDEKEEERRIFYVASSRAMSELTFYKPMLNDKGEMREDSSFEFVIKDHLDIVQPVTGGEGKFMPLQINTCIDIRSRLLKNSEIMAPKPYSLLPAPATFGDPAIDSTDDSEPPF